MILKKAGPLIEWSYAQPECLSFKWFWKRWDHQIPEIRKVLQESEALQCSRCCNFWIQEQRVFECKLCPSSRSWSLTHERWTLRDGWKDCWSAKSFFKEASSSRRSMLDQVFDTHLDPTTMWLSQSQDTIHIGWQSHSWWILRAMKRLDKDKKSSYVLSGRYLHHSRD